MTKENKTLVVKRSLYSWVFSKNIKLQFLLLFIIVITVFTRVLPLEMQKRIVNNAIRLKKLDLLYLYCGLYLLAVVASSGLKYLINALQTVIGQRALADMRKELYHHLLTLPLSFFRKTQPGMVVASLVTELTSAGDFVGMAIAVPITNLLTLLAFAVYLCMLNPLLAVVSLSVYPLVFFVVPLLQRRANKTNKKRVDTTRTLSDKIAESVSGIHEIHGNGSHHIENSKYDHLVDKLLRIRIVWNLYKYGVKVCNNFFTNLSPFFVFILGGYLVIQGRLDLGALVAFLSAQEKLYDPFKELIDFYQVYQDATVSYGRTMEYFDLLPEHLLEPEGREPYQLEGNIEVRDLCFTVEGGIRLIDQINLSLKKGEQLALVGFSGSGKSTLAQCIGQLHKYTGGQVLIDDREVTELSKRDIAYTVGFVSQSPFIFSGTILDNLLYSCLSRSKNGKDASRPLPSLDDMIRVLQQTGIFVDILRFGLNTVLVPENHDTLISKLIRVRESFQTDFGEMLADDVEFFDRNKYLYHSTIAENLTFGASVREEFALRNLSENDYFLRFLDEVQLTRPLLSLGAEMSTQTVTILGNLAYDEVFFEQSPIAPDELEKYKTLVAHLDKKNLHELPDQDRKDLLDLALRLTPGKHKMVALPHMFEQLIVEGRALFRQKISVDDPEAFSFFDRSEYIWSQTILNNILFGKAKTTKSQSQERINQSIIQLLIGEDLLEKIVEIGLQYQVGSKGDKLSGGQRQKLAIARVFLKEPEILIMDEATSALDNKSQARIQNLLETRWKGKSTLIAVVHRLDTIKHYDKIAVMKAGKIMEMGTYDKLIESKGMLYELVFGKQ